MNPLMCRGLRLLALLLMAGAAPGCGGNTAALTGPTLPAATDTYSGTMTHNGGFDYPFASTQAGTVTASYVSIGTDNSIALGLALGTWNGSTCSILLVNDNVTVGVVVSGAVSGAASLCVRVFDVGFVTDPLSYQVQVLHP
jgi:hypothetical protein